MQYGAILNVGVVANVDRIIVAAATDKVAPVFGLMGMRERVAAYEGQLYAGPRPGGGWRVRAIFPVGVA